MIKVDWGNPEKNIVTWKFSSPRTFEEFHVAKRQVDAMIDGVEGSVDSIFLTSAEQAIPPRAVTHLRTIIVNQHKRHRYIVMVGARSMIITLLKIIADLVPNFDPHLYHVQTQNEAYALIAKLRSGCASSLTHLRS